MRKRKLLPNIREKDNKRKKAERKKEDRERKKLADKARARIEREKKNVLNEQQEQLLDRLMTARGDYGDLSKLSGTQRKELYRLELAKFKEQMRTQKTNEETNASSSSSAQSESRPDVTKQDKNVKPWEDEEKTDILR